jgi:hypothetical protein
MGRQSDAPLEQKAAKRQNDPQTACQNEKLPNWKFLNE